VIGAFKIPNHRILHIGSPSSFHWTVTTLVSHFSPEIIKTVFSSYIFTQTAEMK